MKLGESLSHFKVFKRKKPLNLTESDKDERRMFPQKVI